MYRDRTSSVSKSDLSQAVSQRVAWGADSTGMTSFRIRVAENKMQTALTRVTTTWYHDWVPLQREKYRLQELAWNPVTLTGDRRPRHKGQTLFSWKLYLDYEDKSDSIWYEIRVLEVQGPKKLQVPRANDQQVHKVEHVGVHYNQEYSFTNIHLWGWELCQAQTCQQSRVVCC